MKTLHQTLPLLDDPYVLHYFKESYAFFDIETTGFSPKNSFVYLIGMAARKGKTLHIYQFFAKDRSQEQEILSAFHQNLSGIQTLITFNGNGFDLPFLKARKSFYGIMPDWNIYESLDLYKITRKFSRLFQLPDNKQKSLEQFLFIQREDRYNGRDLIPVYHAYENRQELEWENLLLLHNYEDVLGMTKLLPLLSYADFFDMPAEVLSVSKEDLKEDVKKAKKEPKEMPKECLSEKFILCLSLAVSVPFPRPLSFQGRDGLYSFSCSGTSALLHIKVLEGGLRFYYKNYKDYYYLPEEDMAIHKSVAEFVDSIHKQKATAATCYARKSGTFLPQPKPVFTPAFYPGKKSGISYFEMTEDFLSDKASLNQYASQILCNFTHLQANISML